MSVESEHQKKMLAFHATVQEIIKTKELPETPSAYFVAIVSAPIVAYIDLYFTIIYTVYCNCFNFNDNFNASSL